VPVEMETGELDDLEQRVTDLRKVWFPYLR
jgi:hypothetical protein